MLCAMRKAHLGHNTAWFWSCFTRGSGAPLKRKEIITQPLQQKPAQERQAVPFHLSFLCFKNIFLTLISGQASGNSTHTSQGCLQILKTFITTSKGALCITEFSSPELNSFNTVTPLCPWNCIRKATIIIANHNGGEERAEKLFLALEINSEGVSEWESEYLKAQKPIERT